jgi:pyruvate/2-oxoglutarate/acetoin dehydrogenase E1 component
VTLVVESLNEGLRTSLTESQQVYLLGEDILDPYGGAFKVVRGLSTAYPDRVITTPVSEAGIVGLGVGMALRGLRPVVEIMFGDFLLLAADQIVNHAAKMRWMSGGRAKVPMVIRTPMGGRRGYGPTHSQTLEKHFMGAPGLHIVAVSALGNPSELLRRAILEDDDPVLFVEHKLLYACPVLNPDQIPDFEVEILRVSYPVYRVRLQGAPRPAVTIACYGYMTELARQAMRQMAYEHEIFAEMLVYTGLSPLDIEPLLTSAQATRRLVVAEEGTRALGWGAEMLARVGESGGEPIRVRRVAAEDCPVPAAGTLEAGVLPQVEDIVCAARTLVRSG